MPETVYGVVAYTSAEDVAYRRQNFARVVYTVGRMQSIRSDYIFIPRIPPKLYSTQACREQLAKWLVEYLPTKLRPGGVIQYEDLEDEIRIKMGS